MTSASVDAFLAMHGLHLQHSQDTAEDVLNKMAPRARQTFTVILGAVLEDQDLSDDQEVLSSYESLSPTEKVVLNYAVGVAVTSPKYLRHSEVSAFLAHYGVKGMKWGVRRRQGTTGNFSGAKASLASAGAKTLASIKGDKTFWATTGVAMTAASVGGAVLFSSAFMLPTDLLVSVGQATDIGKSFADSNMGSDWYRTIGALTVGDAARDTAAAAATATIIGAKVRNIARVVKSKQTAGEAKIKKTLGKA